MKFFLDSSAILKRYLAEPGSDDVNEIFDVKAKKIGVSIICLFEVLATLSRIQKNNIINLKQYKRLKHSFMNDFKDFKSLSVGYRPEFIIEVIERSYIKGMDSIHIGTAISWQAQKFVTGDRQQLKAAQEAGLETMLVG